MIHADIKSARVQWQNTTSLVQSVHAVRGGIKETQQGAEGDGGVLWHPIRWKEKNTHKKMTMIKCQSLVSKTVGKKKKKSTEPTDPRDRKWQNVTAVEHEWKCWTCTQTACKTHPGERSVPGTFSTTPAFRRYLFGLYVSGSLTEPEAFSFSRQ